MHARQHPLHAAHHFTHAALAEHFHHLLRLLKLIKQLVDVHHLHPGPGSDTAFARGFEQFRVGAFLRRHGVDDAFGAVDGFVIHFAACRSLGKLGGQLVHQRRHAAHLAHLHDLHLVVIEVKSFAALNFLRQFLRFGMIYFAVRFFDQRQHVAHAQHARGHALGMEGFQAVEFFRSRRQI